MAALLSFAACGSKDNPDKQKDALDFTGEWKLTDIQTKAAAIGGVQVSVYLSFENGSFTLYQKIGEGRYTKLTGTYSLEGELLSGSYSSGDKWGASYNVSVDGDTLTLIPVDGTEKDIYKKTSIPDDVKTSAL